MLRNLAYILSLTNPNFALNSFFRVEFASEFIGINFFEPRKSEFKTQKNSSQSATGNNKFRFPVSSAENFLLFPVADWLEFFWGLNSLLRGSKKLIPINSEANSTLKKDFKAKLGLARERTQAKCATVVFLNSTFWS